MNLNFHENHKLLFGVVFFGFILLTIIIAVGPAIWVQQNNKPLPGSRVLTDQEQRGLDIYVAEGCLYCHTQQVRPLEVDKPFGRPSAPGDYARLKPQDRWRGTPAVLGTERNGPDLSNIGSRQPSKTWQYMHLYNPRSVVKDSIMQAYPWLFEIKKEPGPKDTVLTLPADFAPKEGHVVLTEKARDLVAYLLSLQQVPVPGIEGAGGEARPPSGGANQPETAMGASVYASNCASCHQPDGEGIPGTFPPLKGNEVVTAKDPTRHVEIVLFGLQGKTIDGVKYSSPMPAHEHVLTDAEVAAVVNHERTSWGNNAPTVTAEEVKKIRTEKEKEGHRDE